MKGIRTGLGFDVHRFSSKKKFLVLAGIKINCGFGVSAVSDGDVVLHTVCDALLGAASCGDIGDYFPTYSNKSKGIKSTKIVDAVLKRIYENFKIINIDITIVSEKPPLAKHKKKMLVSLKGISNIKNINIKIKSKEGLNILGGINSIACLCIATLLEKSPFKS